MACIDVTNHAITFEVETKFGSRLEFALERNTSPVCPEDHTDTLWNELNEAFVAYELRAMVLESSKCGSVSYTVDINPSQDISDVLVTCEKVVREWADNLGIEQWKDL